MTTRFPHPDEIPPTPIPHDLALDLAEHLQLIIRGAIPNPEYAAPLLRRLNDAIRQSQPREARNINSKPAGKPVERT